MNDVPHTACKYVLLFSGAPVSEAFTRPARSACVEQDSTFTRQGGANIVLWGSREDDARPRSTDAEGGRRTQHNTSLTRREATSGPALINQRTSIVLVCAANTRKSKLVSQRTVALACD
jgi:hypothetical protein